MVVVVVEFGLVVSRMSVIRQVCWLVVGFRQASLVMMVMFRECCSVCEV